MCLNTLLVFRINTTVDLNRIGRSSVQTDLFYHFNIRAIYWAAPIPQWIRLRLPSWCFHFFNLNLNCSVTRTKINKKRPGLAHSDRMNVLKPHFQSRHGINRVRSCLVQAQLSKLSSKVLNGKREKIIFGFERLHSGKRRQPLQSTFVLSFAVFICQTFSTLFAFATFI